MSKKQRQWEHCHQNGQKFCFIVAGRIVGRSVTKVGRATYGKKKKNSKGENDENPYDTSYDTADDNVSMMPVTLASRWRACLANIRSCLDSMGFGVTQHQCVLTLGVDDKFCGTK